MYNLSLVSPLPLVGRTFISFYFILMTDNKTLWLLFCSFLLMIFIVIAHYLWFGCFGITTFCYPISEDRLFIDYFQ